MILLSFICTLIAGRAWLTTVSSIAGLNMAHRGRGRRYRHGHGQLHDSEPEVLDARYAKRTLGTNADRYEEPDPEIGPDGTNNIKMHTLTS